MRRRWQIRNQTHLPRGHALECCPVQPGAANHESNLVGFLEHGIRRLGLAGTEWAQAQVDTIRLKLLKIGALVRIRVRRITLQLSSAYPWKNIFAQAFHALRC